MALPKINNPTYSLELPSTGKEIKFRDNKPTYLISNNSKLKKLNIKFKKFKNNLNYFY